MENYLIRLKESGAKLTVQRKAILQKLSDAEKPLTLQEIHKSCSNIDFASIYRNITLFLELSLVEKVIFADNKTRYELASNSHHHHIICSSCGKISELQFCVLSEIETITHYKVTKHILEFMGLCPSCQD